MANYSVGARYGAWFAGIALLLGCVLLGLAAQGSFSSKVKVEAVGGDELRVDRVRGHYYAAGAVDGVPAVFLLDTGASLVALNAEIARKAGLTEGEPMTVNTANGEAEGYAVKVRELEVGPFRLHDVRAVVLPQMDGEVLLGMNVLGSVDWRQENGRLVITLPQE